MQSEIILKRPLSRLLSLQPSHSQDISSLLSIPFLIFITLICSGIYGATIGIWRAPLQAVYTAIKFPLIMLLTMMLNAGINGILANLTGSALSFRNSIWAVIYSMAITSIMLASLSTVSLFFVWNTPELGDASARSAHATFTLFQVFFIALAGMVGHLRMYEWLKKHATHHSSALLLLASWLTINLLVGGQLSWIGRPFTGAPSLPVEFLRSNALESNFFEAVQNNYLFLIN